MIYYYLTIFAGLIMAVILIISYKKFSAKPEYKEFNGLKFQWLDKKFLPKDEMPHWQCKKDCIAISVIPPTISCPHWRVIKETQTITICYQEVECEQKAFELAVKWAK